MFTMRLPVPLLLAALLALASALGIGAARAESGEPALRWTPVPLPVSPAVFAPALALLARRARRRSAALLLVVVAPAFAAAPPEHLRDTGIDGDGVIPFAPTHALWSDGTTKRRWIRLPPGTAIDASDPDAWRFPRGTKLWKEFAYGARIETRYITLGSDGRWSFATYVWNADAGDARLAPERGIARLPVADAPGGRWAIPSRDDCTTCHAGARTPVLGFSALQLGDALPELVRRGLIVRGPVAWRERAPEIVSATEAERAARGHLHANCGHCHHERGAPVPLVLAQRVAGTPAPPLAQLETALHRMGTRDPLKQMPPLGTRVVDEAGLAKVRAWLDETTQAVSLVPSGETK